MFKKIAIFVPVHNESEKLAHTLERIPDVLNGSPTEIVVVDDGSTDGSADIARKFTSHVVALPENRGVGVATRTGLMYIAERGGYRFVIKFDADGQHNLEFLPAVENALHTCDAIVCSRFHPSSDQTYTPPDRILLNMLFVEMLRKITGWNLTDVRSGYMGFQFEDIRAFASDIIVEQYGVPMELLLRLWRRRPDAFVYEIPHPAMYDRRISSRLNAKYSSETISHQADRLKMGYEALLSVIVDLEITKEHLLTINGFSKVGT